MKKYLGNRYLWITIFVLIYIALPSLHMYVKFGPMVYEVIIIVSSVVIAYLIFYPSIRRAAQPEPPEKPAPKYSSVGAMIIIEQPNLIGFLDLDFEEWRAIKENTITNEQLEKILMKYAHTTPQPEIAHMAWILAFARLRNQIANPG